MNENNMVIVSILLIINLSCEQSKQSTAEIESTESSSSFFINSSEDTLTYTSGIRAIFHDSKGNYWFGSHQEGVARFDGESFRYFTVEDGLSDNQVRSIQEGKDGTIWFGTAKGVSSFDGDHIEQHHLDISRQNGLGSQNLNRVRAADLWFNAGDKPGFYRSDGRKLIVESFPVEMIESSYGNFAYGVTGFSKARLDYGWIATYSAVFGYDGTNFKVIDDQYLEFYEGIGGNLHVRSVLEDSKGNLWIGNNGIGVLHYDGNTVVNFSAQKGLIDPETTDGDRSKAGTMEHVFAITEDTHGNIWFGDRDTGAWRFDGEKMTNFIVDPKLETQMIWGIYEDMNGDLLFAMGKGGVYAFNGSGFDRKF